jgi:hypothetical protein
MRHYVGVFVPLEPNGWRALFPDFPGCVAEAPSLEIAICRAADSLLQHAGSLGSGIYLSPMSRNAAANRLDEKWATAHGFSLRTAIISMIPLRGNDNQQQAWNAVRDWDLGAFVSQLQTPRPAGQPQIEASVKPDREFADMSAASMEPAA